MKADYCEGKVHIIEEGDTLYQLSRRYKIPLALILRANPFTDVYNLQVGDEICIPVELGRPPEQPSCSHCQGSCGRLERPNPMVQDAVTEDSSFLDVAISTDQLNRQNNMESDQMNQRRSSEGSSQMNQQNQQNNDARMGQSAQLERNVRMNNPNQVNSNTRMNQPAQSENNVGMNNPSQTNSNVRTNQPAQSENNVGMDNPNQANSDTRINRSVKSENNVGMDNQNQTDYNGRLSQTNQQNNNVRPMPPFMPNFPTMPEMPNRNNSQINSDRPITLPSFPNLFSYIVEEGESLGDILDNFDVNLEDLLNFNDLDELELCPGSVVKVPIRRENGRN